MNEKERQKVLAANKANWWRKKQIQEARRNSEYPLHRRITPARRRAAVLAMAEINHRPKVTERVSVRQRIRTERARRNALKSVVK